MEAVVDKTTCACVLSLSSKYVLLVARHMACHIICMQEHNCLWEDTTQQVWSLSVSLSLCLSVSLSLCLSLSLSLSVCLSLSSQDSTQPGVWRAITRHVMSNHPSTTPGDTAENAAWFNLQMHSNSWRSIPSLLLTPTASSPDPPPPREDSCASVSAKSPSICNPCCAAVSMEVSLEGRTLLVADMNRACVRVRVCVCVRARTCVHVCGVGNKKEIKNDGLVSQSAQQ